MTLYEKRGKRYYPVRDTEAYSGLGQGSWLVVVNKGVTSVRQVIKPDHAGFLAAARVAHDAMTKAVVRATELRPMNKPSAREKKALAAFKEVMGDRTMWLTSGSALDIAQAGIDAVQQEMENHGKDAEGKAASGVGSTEASRDAVQETGRASVA